MDRFVRVALTLAAATALTMSSAACVHAAESAPATVIKRIYATADGESRMEEIRVADAKGLPAESITAATFKKGASEGWHVTPAKFLVVSTSGTYDIILSDQSVVSFAPGEMAYFDDLTGRGHNNLTTSAGSVLLLKMPDSFDIDAWKKLRQAVDPAPSPDS